MTILQVIIFALVQGVTELFPISSLGHAVVLPALLHWNVDEAGEGFLPFLVVMHLGTAIALLAYFWRDWWDFARAVLAGRGSRAAQERRVFWRVVVATIPAVILGAALEKALRHVFASPSTAAAFLIVNGAILYAAQRAQRGETKALDALTWADAVKIGLWQCLALIPGLSRSGTTMVGGFRAGLAYDDAARFSFLTATPIILGATALEAPKLLKHKAEIAAVAGPDMLKLSLIGGVAAGLAAYAALSALMRWFKRHEFRAFDPFAYYCAAAGAAFLIALRFAA